MACYEYKGVKYTEEELVKLLQSQQPKTRRILEVQSDLFQKGRDKQDLTTIINSKIEDWKYKAKTSGINTENGKIGYNEDSDRWYIVTDRSGTKNITLDEAIDLSNGRISKNENIKGNQFLQLLNKDNNWVTFFVKSIIQDSAKKGYEKVLFPTGNTASKVEGHTTLEEFKKQKEDRIRVLEDVISKNKKLKEKEPESLFDAMFPSMEIENAQNEINQIKDELEKVEREGFGALKPIWNFYENTVTNILKKIYNVKPITDEYGNTWNEIDLLDEKSKAPILLSKGATAKKYTLQIGKKDFTKGTYTFKEIFNNIGENSYATKLLKQLYMLSNQNIDNMKIEIVDSLDEAIGNYNPETHTISLSLEAIKGDELLAHEIIHALTAIKIAYWEKKHPDIYKKLEEVYLRAKDKLDNEEYAFSNIHEFYAHLSDSEFVERLATIKSEGFWSKFIDLISSMLSKLGINIQNTLAEEALNNLETIITTRLAKENVQEGIDNLKEAKLNMDLPFDNESIDEDEKLAAKETSPLEPTDISGIERLDFWKEIAKVYNNMAGIMSKDATTVSGYTLFQANKKEVETIAKQNNANTELEKAIRQGATIAQYVAKLKYNLLDKKKEGIGKGNAYSNVASKSLLNIAKDLKKIYSDEETIKELSQDEHLKNVTILNYLKNYVNQHKSVMAGLKATIRESINQSEQINEYLTSIGESSTYNSTIQDMQEVIDTFEAIELMDLGNVVAGSLGVAEWNKISKSIEVENKNIELFNNKLDEQIRQTTVKMNEAPEEEKQKYQDKIDKLDKKRKDKQGEGVLLNVGREIADGNNFGFFMATFASISDLGDKALTLLRNRIEDAFQKLQEGLIPLVEQFAKGWNEYKEENDVELNDDKTFDKFLETRTYIDFEGVEHNEKHFITGTDTVKYFEAYHKCNNKVTELWDKVRELKYPELGENPTEQELNQLAVDRKEYYNKKQAIFEEMDLVKDEFINTLSLKKSIVGFEYDEDGNKIEVENPSFRKYLAYQYKVLTETLGEKEGREQFEHLLNSVFDIRRMKRTKSNKAEFNQLSDRNFMKRLIDELSTSEGGESVEIGGQKVIFIKNYKSSIYQPKSSAYPSSKLSNLTPSERKLYDMLYNEYMAAQELLPAYARPGTRIPSISKTMAQKLMNNQLTPKGFFEEMVKTHTTDEISENQDNSIPIYYTNNKMDINDISTNLIQSVLLFSKQARAYNTKSKTIHYATALRDNVGKTKAKYANDRPILNGILRKLGIEQKIPIGTDWRNWFLDRWIDQTFYGKTNTPIEVAGIRVDKVLQKLAAFSAFGTLGGVKIVSHLTNLSMANISNLLESTGYFEGSDVQPLFTKGQYFSAIKTSGKVMFDQALDFLKRDEFPNSIYGQIMEEFEPIQGEFFNNVGSTINTHLVSDMAKIWFSPMHLGDTMPQTMALIATMKNIPVTLLDGTKTDLWEALIRTDNLQANWENIEGWKIVKKDFFDNKKRKLDDLNRKMHGNYNSIGNIDRPVIRQVVIGQLFEMYRKYIVPGMIKRYGKAQYNLESGEYEEGRYRTLFRYILNDMKWMLKADNKGISPLDIFNLTPENLEKIRKYYSDAQIVNIRKAVAEQAFITLTSCLAVILYGLAKGGDDDDNMYLMTAAAVTLRVSRDFNFFTPVSIDAPFTEDGSLTVPITTSVSDFGRIFKQPFAVQRTIDNLQSLSTILTSNPFEEYKQGKQKGENKGKIKLYKLLGISTGANPSDVMSLMYEKSN